MDRRDSLKILAGAALLPASALVPGRAYAQAPAAAPSPPPGPFMQPPLPFHEAQLAPAIGARTVTLHYGRHHASYYTNLNNLTKDSRFATMKLPELVVESNKETDRRIFNNAGQAWNHELYWDQFKPGGAKAPGGKLAEMITSAFGGLDQFKAKLKADTTGVFGSGWGWLAQDGDKLVSVTTTGGDNPVTKNTTPLLGIDVWEHAYYLDYENRRPDHIQAVLDNIVNWDVVASRLKS
jgi:superoxide dismutase, Fe-Mn family